jgi:hypothetical protein
LVPFPSLTPTPSGILAQLVESGSIVLYAFICLLILIWAALAVGIFIYLQNRYNNQK